MSLHLEFEPHSWYMGFAIKKLDYGKGRSAGLPKWAAYTADGNTYRIVDLSADSIAGLHLKIRTYHLRECNSYGERIAKRRLEYLRQELRAERMSYGELAELQHLAEYEYINDDDTELLEAAGIEEVTR